MIAHVLLAAAAALPNAPPIAPPPATLSAYIKGGTFDPGDYGWLRGLFDGATPAQISEWKATDAWLRQCRAASFAQVRQELIAAEIASPAIHSGAYGEALCGAVDMAFPQGDMGKDWALFQTKLASARRVSTTLIWSAALAQGVGSDAGDTLPAQLNARPITDQILRMSLSWNEGDQKGAPSLDPMEAGIVRALTWSAIRARDHANTAWMKTVVAQHGWPTTTAVGARASNNAWLLVQHADDDPVFQLKMLRLMEPFAATGEVEKKNFALLHDRVMLQMTGKQRYGTQWTCETGTWQPRPLDNKATVDADRASVGVGTLAENGERIARNYGPCPLTSP